MSVLRRAGDIVGKLWLRLDEFFIAVASILVLANLVGLYQLTVTADVESADGAAFGGTLHDQNHPSRDGQAAADHGVGRPGRFPRFGSDEFKRQCSWTLMSQASYNCTILSTPQPGNHEGVSNWVTSVAMSYLVARQAGCKLYVDYGSVNIHDVLATPGDLGYDAKQYSSTLNDWRVPTGWTCRKENNCIVEHFQPNIPPDGIFNNAVGFLGKLAPIPRYRFAYQFQSGWLYSGEFNELEQALPGFQLDTGMACIINNLFHLAPSAAKYESRLFGELLPTLRENLSLTLYIRTGQAEVDDDIESSVSAILRDSIVNATIESAVALEQKYLSGQLIAPSPFSQVVWMVVTDDVRVKRTLKNGFDGKAAGSLTQSYQQKQYQSGSQSYQTGIPSVHRRVMVTGAKGAHTRLESEVSTADFAGAMIDWYLIGESDVVIADTRYSFGTTAAMRNSLPVYDPLKKGDTPEALVHPGLPPLGQAQSNKDRFSQQLEQFCDKHPGSTGKISVDGNSYKVKCPKK